jgi:ribosomal protein S18 acetylase RimI-like enzyme
MAKEMEYTETGQDGLDSIAPLWQKLNDHHGAISRYFSERYPRHTFAQRKQELLEKSNGGAIRVDLACDAAMGELVGYCVSTVTAAGTGEIDSIYVEEDYRRGGIGDKLMTKALKWLAAQAVARKIIAVASGNEEVHAFYGRYDFYPRCTILEQVDSTNTENHD